MDICTSGGIGQAKADDKNPAPGAPAERNPHCKHCPSCCTHGGLPALPPTAGFMLPAARDGQAHPFLYRHSPRPLFLWAATLPRAPPVVS